ncbi:hypothetical protein ABT061_09100 [Streptosporangium sp. NPDC002544]|uniref:hypothetical protein n=1 Tax=Streptosporangium sp. NPDC002544 TaxID=3154538 RepID=UPI003322C894
MREPRWGTPRPTAAVVVGLVLMVVLAAVAPSPSPGGRRPAGTATGLWVPQTGDAYQATAPRLLAGGAEHLPTPRQLRSLPAAGAVAASSTPPSRAWLPVEPAAVSRRDVQRIVTSRSPPPS